uniref:NADH-ubiquinone oxidoreductase chain 6 n=1 Tax=Pseudothemis zonata TaxID=257050 RepID=A0A7M1I7H9_9ODON|nr:NADH dehydrogenase subunit 6 [Pseudothemis zonata]QOQ35030.1 NADH dehydrogenase subunit 6 [Pseudothemis zonata]
MSQILCSILMIMNSLLFSSMKHPMNMGLMLLLQTLMMAILTGMMSYTSWFSYILFLVFLGGMLVLFIYMTSIASNEFFNKSTYSILFIIIVSTMLLLMMMLMDPLMISMPSMQEYMNQATDSKMTMTTLYNNPSSIITVFMVMYLFLTLIIIVSITKFNKGPLRAIN